MADPLNFEAIKCHAHRFDRAQTVRRPCAKLGDHRIVEHRDLAALEHARVVAHGGLARRRIALPLARLVQRACLHLGGWAIARQSPNRRQEVAIGVFGVKAAFHRPARQLDVVLREGQLFTGGHADHLFDQIDAGDQFGDGMFHLKPGVHLEEVEVAVAVHDEFHRSGAGIAHRTRQRAGLFAHRAACFGIKERRGCLFDDLLVAALDRTFPLAQIKRVAMAIGQDLNFDMARLGHEFLDKDPIIAEARFRLVL